VPPPPAQPGGYPTSNYPTNPYPPVPSARPRKKRRGLVIGLSTAALVVVIGLAATVIAITTGHSPFTPSDPTPTLKGVRGEDSGWMGHLPDPCAGVPDAAIREAGFNPESRKRDHGKVMVSCFYRSPQPSGLAYNATFTYALTVSFLVYTFQEHLDNTSRVDRRETRVQGQRANFYRVEGWFPPDGEHQCLLVVGTVFGTVSYTIADDLNYHLTQQQTCDKVLAAANAFQPYIPTSPLH